ncbi:hypothetical protein VTN77DRAFT_6807 [Rasamsonia byssochlamydoides]|uniref:uncharacterized protein n=1 Tax=Rasamsonia byssochlamydoides TaxID=89139 RepID=UPI00374425EC
MFHTGESRRRSTMEGLRRYNTRGHVMGIAITRIQETTGNRQNAYSVGEEDVVDYQVLILCKLQAREAGHGHRDPKKAGQHRQS